jgi:hypothetical protein
MPAPRKISEKNIIKFILEYQIEHGYSPGYRDFSKIGISSTSVVKYHIDRMAARGLLVLPPAQIARAIVVTEKGRQYGQ